MLTEVAKGTRSDPRFALPHPEMKRFSAYLQSYDGERKPEHEAKAEHEAKSITTDVSKFLKYASPDRINWLVVTETQRARQ